LEICASGGLGRCADVEVRVLGEHGEQRHLLMSARSQRAACSQQADVPGHFAAAEEIEEGASNPDVHQGVT
jgi:hypothetical protein